MEKAEIVEQEVIDASRVSINSKIRKLRKWSYYPIPAIALIHFVVLYSLVPTKDYLIEIDPYFYADYYFHFGYITIGSFLMILVGNFVKGAQIFDPNKRFWGGMGRRW